MKKLLLITSIGLLLSSNMFGQKTPTLEEISKKAEQLDPEAYVPIKTPMEKTSELAEQLEEDIYTITPTPKKPIKKTLPSQQIGKLKADISELKKEIRKLRSGRIKFLQKKDVKAKRLKKLREKEKELKGKEKKLIQLQLQKKKYK